MNECHHQEPRASVRFSNEESIWMLCTTHENKQKIILVFNFTESTRDFSCSTCCHAHYWLVSWKLVFAEVQFYTKFAYKIRCFRLESLSLVLDREAHDNIRACRNNFFVWNIKEFPVNVGTILQKNFCKINATKFKYHLFGVTSFHHEQWNKFKHESILLKSINCWHRNGAEIAI